MASHHISSVILNIVFSAFNDIRRSLYLQTIKSNNAKRSTFYTKWLPMTCFIVVRHKLMRLRCWLDGTITSVNRKKKKKKSRTMDANGCGRWRVSFANKRIPFDCHRLVGRFFDLFRYHVILFSNVIIFNSSCEIYFSWIIAFADKAHATESFRWMEMPSNCEFVIKRN